MSCSFSMVKSLRMEAVLLLQRLAQKKNHLENGRATMRFFTAHVAFIPQVMSNSTSTTCCDLSSCRILKPFISKVPPVFKGLENGRATMRVFTAHVAFNPQVMSNSTGTTCCDLSPCRILKPFISKVPANNGEDQSSTVCSFARLLVPC